MNLADAIRISGGSWPPAPPASAQPAPPSQAPAAIAAVKAPPTLPKKEVAEAPDQARPDAAAVLTEEPTGEPAALAEEPSEAEAPEPAPLPKAPEPPQVTSGNVVRLELFLSGEQMAGMLRALLVGQHSVLTLKEAASYLRLGPAALQELAEQGEIPGLFLDGKWRFPKTSLDEWMASCAGSRSAAGTEDENVA